VLGEGLLAELVDVDCVVAAAGVVGSLHRKTSVAVEEGEQAAEKRLKEKKEEEETGKKGQYVRRCSACCKRSRRAWWRKNRSSWHPSLQGKKMSRLAWRERDENGGRTYILHL
jgi:hypothetical protein